MNPFRNTVYILHYNLNGRKGDTASHSAKAIDSYLASYSKAELLKMTAYVMEEKYNPITGVTSKNEVAWKLKSETQLDW